MINRTILLYSGDILNYYDTKKGINALMKPERQSNEALTRNLEFNLDENNSIILDGNLNVVRLKNDEKQYPRTTCNNYPKCHELTLKIFIHNETECLISKCVSMVLTELNFTYIDNLIVSFDSATSEETVYKIWSQIAQEKKDGRVLAIGVADFCEHKLSKLLSRSATRPDFDQLAPDKAKGFCGISKELMNFANNNNIKLKSHGDPACNPDLMALDVIDQFTRKQISRSSKNHIFTARYSQVSKDRMALTKRGFFHFIKL